MFGLRAFVECDSCGKRGYAEAKVDRRDLSDLRFQTNPYDGWVISPIMSVAQCRECAEISAKKEKR